MKKQKVNYLKRFKAISSFVDFKYTPKFLQSKGLTQKQKLKITKYFKEVSALKNRPHKIYKTKSQSKLLKAQQYSGQDLKKFPLLKAAFIPTGKSQKVKVSFKKGKIYVQEDYVTTTEILFVPSKLLKEPIKHVKEVIAKNKAKSFNIMAGRYEIPAGYNRSSLPAVVAKLMSRYDQPLDRRGKKNNHYFKNWLYGVRAHEFKKQASFEKYTFDKKKAIEEQKKKRRSKRGK